MAFRFFQRGPRPRADPSHGQRESLAFRRWVHRTYECEACGARPVDPHHVRAKGVGCKRPWEHDPWNVCPLCRRCHTKGHRKGWETVVAIPLQVAAARHVWRRWLEVREDVLAEEGDLDY